MGFSQPLGKRREAGRHCFDRVKNRGFGPKQNWIRISAMWLLRVRFFIYKMGLILTVIITIMKTYL